MDIGKKHISLAKSLFIVTTLSMIGTAAMVHFDAFDRFYRHSRQFEYFNYDEIVIFMALFLLFGLLCLSFRLYRLAIWECGHPQLENAAVPDRPPPAQGSGSFKAPSKLLAYSYRSPLLLMTSLIILIGVVEVLDMTLLSLILPLPFPFDVLADAIILITVISPALFFIFFRPMQRQFVIRERAELALNHCNLELESRVLKRTAELEKEIAERKKTEQKLQENQKQLRLLSSELAQVEEKERRRIATDLHDNIGQNLALIKNRLSLLGSSCLSREKDIQLESIKDLADETIRYSRNLIFELSSPLLDFLSFESALEWLAEDLLGNHQIAYHLTMEDTSRPLADAQRIPLLKAIREVLVNIVKHAQARKVKIRVCNEKGAVMVEIGDDGIGFEVPEDFLPAKDRRSLGLFSIQERLTGMGGEFSLLSEPGQGTRVRLTVPNRQKGAGRVS